MKTSVRALLANLYKWFPWIPKQRTDTLTAFVRDTEHDVLSVVAALQANVDVLHDEQERKHQPVTRFLVMNKAIARITADMTALADISELVLTPPSKQRQLLSKLMQEIAQETQSAFSLSKATFSCSVVAGTTVIGNTDALKVMITAIVLTVLAKCPELQTVWMAGRVNNDCVWLSFNSGLQADEGVFTPWQLGELRLAPTNGEGISLATVDALARLHHGHLSRSTLPDLRHGYRLILKV